MTQPSDSFTGTDRPAAPGADQAVALAPVRAEDRDAWQRLWVDYLAHYETRLPPEVLDATFARLSGPDPAMQGIMARVGGQPRGLVHFLLHDHFWRPEGVTYLQDLDVDPEARGTGLGRRLIEAVYAASDAMGRPSVYWVTQDFNTNARLLYDRIGELTPFIKYQRPTKPAAAAPAREEEQDR